MEPSMSNFKLPFTPADLKHFFVFLNISFQHHNACEYKHFIHDAIESFSKRLLLYYKTKHMSCQAPYKPLY